MAGIESTYSDNTLALPSTGHAEPWPSGTERTVTEDT